MRAILAAVLLLVHLEPLAGVAICRGLAMVSPEQMEEDCPMTGAPRAAATETRRSGGAAAADEAPLDCLFTKAILAGGSALVRDRADLRLGLPPSETVSWLSARMRGAENPSPPVPPPNS
jgi:hypothetical protein